MRSNQCVTQNNAGYEKTRENEGVAAYFPHVETRRDTSPHEENSCVGGDFPLTKKKTFLTEGYYKF